jgi:hypothetical protein
MLKLRFLALLLPLLLLGCGEDESTVQPPAPLTPDEQVVANARALRDAVEATAAANGGSFGEGWLEGIISSVNPYSGEEEPSGPIGGSPGQLAVEAYPDCDGHVLGYRITGYGNSGVLITLENVASVPLEIQYQYDLTMTNVRLLFDAAKRYAAANNGEYAQDVAGTPNDEGNTLVDLLPNGELLFNPFTSTQDNPVDGDATGTPFGIGYTALDIEGEGTISGFMIDAHACEFWTTAVLLPYTLKEEDIVHDALGLRVALHAFKQASGHFPHDLDTETTPGGKTVVDLYFEDDRDFENPFTKQDYVPVIGTATNKGEVAYQPIETAGVVTSFTITGRGRFAEILRIGPFAP